MDEEGFEVFWAVYPRRVAKMAARKAWQKIHPNELPQITAAIEAYKGSGMWDDIQFIPHPATFLNGRRWEDEIPGRTVKDRDLYNAINAGSSPWDHLPLRKRVM